MKKNNESTPELDDVKLTIRTLGQFKINWGEAEWHAFRTKKTRALFLYLAIANGKSFEREHLAALFWPNATKKAGLASLRMSLSALRKNWEKLSDQPEERLFSITRNTTQMQSQIIDCDILSLREALESADEKQLIEVAIHVSGEFVPGFGLNDSDQFDDWMLLLRDRTDRQIIELFERLIALYGERGDWGKSADYSRRLIEIDNLRESSWHLLFHTLGASKNTQSLEEAYEWCVQTLFNELGVDPSPETVKAFQDAQEVASKKEELPSEGNIGESRTPLFGRAEEIKQLRNDLKEKDKRLITLLGVGGTGKSSLAKEVGRTVKSDFAHGVWFISFVGSQTNDFLTTVGDVLGINFHGGKNRLEQLIKHLKQRNMLLIFDNFEDVIDESLLVSDLLAGTDQLKIVCTSRQALEVQEEWIFQLDGLDLPPWYEDNVAQFSSVQLFVQRAQQTSNRFEFTVENAKVIAEICRFVNGSPLGIELAAAWMRKQSAENLLTTMREMPDMLRTKRRDVPERQRSMRAIFDYTFAWLDAPLQAILPRLSLFSTRFTLQQALEVAQASRLDLTELLDNSLLQEEENGYRLHPLVRSFSADLLPEDSPSKHAFSQSFLTWVAEQEVAIMGVNGESVAMQLSRSYEDIVTAWYIAIQNKAYELLHDTHATLVHFWGVRGQFEDGIHLFEDTLARLEHSSDTTILQGQIKARLAGLYMQIGQFEKGATIAQSAQKNAEGEGLGWVYLHQGDVYRQKSQWDLAFPLYEQALEIFMAQESFVGGARTLTAMGIAALRDLKFVEADQHFTESLRLSRIVGDAWGEADALLRLSLVTRRQNKLAESRQWAESALTLCKQRGDLASLSGALNVLSQLAIDEVRFEEAVEMLTRAEEINEQLNLVSQRLFTTWFLGIALLKLDRLDPSETKLRQALDYARDLDDHIYWEAHIQLDLARIELATDRRVAALARIERSLEIEKLIDNEYVRDSAAALMSEIQTVI